MLLEDMVDTVVVMEDKDMVSKEAMVDMEEADMVRVAGEMEAKVDGDNRY